MSDLIDRFDLLEEIEKYHRERKWEYKSSMRSVGDIIEIIEKAPVFYSEPVRNGIWIEDCGLVQCSACYEEYRVRTNYCPNCGAKMDKEEQDG